MSKLTISNNSDSCKCWSLQWYSRNALDGISKHFLWHATGKPAVFRTRREARAWANEKYGYIKDRLDLRVEPHGWRMPRAVRVRVTVEVV